MSDGASTAGEYRTRSWDRAIVAQHKLGGNVTLVEYQPGNGTRYGVTFVYVPKDIAGPEAPRSYINAPCWIVSLADMNCAMEVAESGNLLHWGYVAEKLSNRRRHPMGPADAVPLAELIGRITGRPVVSSAEQEQRDAAARAEAEQEREELEAARLPPIEALQGQEGP